MNSTESPLKVAVIGAGAAGLCAGRHLQAEPDRFELDIFEQQEDVGGTWRYTDRVGYDEYGLPVHSSMYKNLKANLPIELMVFPDFPSTYSNESYLHHSEILQYLKDYADHFHLYEYIKFHKLIENVKLLKRTEDRSEWSVTYSDVITKEKETKICNAVIVCTGHYFAPVIPQIPGLNEFKNLVMHSHDYRDATSFKDLKVVVLGAGPSGIDIGTDIASVAKEVILSHNLDHPLLGSFPENLKQEKGIKLIDKTSVTFIDGVNYECDALILCNGYKYHFPFLDSSCNIQITDYQVSPLYLHLFHINNPTLAILSVVKKSLPFKIYDQQAKVFLKFLKGLISLPDPEVMRTEAEKDFEERLKSGFKREHAHVISEEFFIKYDDVLSKFGDIDPITDRVRNLFRFLLKLRANDVLNYGKIHQSLVHDGSLVLNE